jgi:thioredoxin-dependent peroxiredoxin
MPRLVPGDTAPDFTLPTADGGTLRLSEFAGRRVIVYFFPAAMTAGCTTQACDFRDSLAALDGQGLSVVGVSPDPVEKLATFAEQEGLTFPLASDVERDTLRRWGAYGEKIKDGASVMGVIRSTVVVGADRTVELAEYGVAPAGHVAWLRERIGVG